MLQYLVGSTPTFEVGPILNADGSNYTGDLLGITDFKINGVACDSGGTANFVRPGIYSLTLTATDTATAGPARVGLDADPLDMAFTDLQIGPLMLYHDPRIEDLFIVLSSLSNAVIPTFLDVVAYGDANHYLFCVAGKYNGQYYYADALGGLGSVIYWNNSTLKWVLAASLGAGGIPSTTSNITGAWPAATITATRLNLLTDFGAAQTATPFATMAAVNGHVYTVRLDFTRDDTGGNDEYTAVWYRDDVPATDATAVQIHVLDRSDGSDLVAAVNMVQIATTGVWKYDEAVNRLTPGTPAIAIVTATIDAATRTRIVPIARDD